MNRALSVFANKRMLITLLLGFSSGLPLSLIGETLQAWLTKSNIDIATIGQFALVGLPYALKFLWAPLLDQKALPFLGLRRGWMAIAQLGLFATTVGLAFSDPIANISLFSLMCLLLAFFSATQDILVDAYRIEIIEDKAEIGAGASTYITGYRFATILSGGVALILADHYSWTFVYALMAIINLVGLATILLSPEPKTIRKKSVLSLKDSVARPFVEFFQRKGAMDILIFVMVYKIPTLMATALMTKFLISLDYSLTMIGIVKKGPGFAATIIGVLCGGALMTKLGMKRSLWIFGIVQALGACTFLMLSHFVEVGTPEDLKSIWLTVAISMDNFMMGLGTVAITGFMMNFCNRQFTATQYSLLTSVVAVGRVILIAHAGTLVEWLGWDLFFLFTIPLALPGLLLLSRYDQWQSISNQPITAQIPKFDRVLVALFVFSLIALSSEPIFKFFEQKEVGAQATLVGAFSVLFVVTIGLARPYLRAKAT